jgi:hypothetical protein
MLLLNHKFTSQNIVFDSDNLVVVYDVNLLIVVYIMMGDIMECETSITPVDQIDPNHHSVSDLHPLFFLTVFTEHLVNPIERILSNHILFCSFLYDGFNSDLFLTNHLHYLFKHSF